MSLLGTRVIRGRTASVSVPLASGMSKRCIRLLTSIATSSSPKRTGLPPLSALVTKSLVASAPVSHACHAAPLSGFSSMAALRPTLKATLGAAPLARPATPSTSAAASSSLRAALAPTPVRALSSSSTGAPKQDLNEAVRSAIKALRARTTEVTEDLLERVKAKWATMTISDRVIALAIGAVPVLYLAGKMFKFIIIGFLLWRFFPGLRRNLAQALLVRGNREAAWLLSPNPRLPLYQPGLTPEEMRKVVDEFADNTGSMSGDSFEGADLIRRELARARDMMTKAYDQRFSTALRESIEPETPTLKEYVPIDDAFFEDYFAPGARVQWGNMQWMMTDPSGRADADLPAPFNAAPGAAANASIAFPVVDSLGRDELGYVLIRCRVGPSRFVSDERDRLRSVYERMVQDPEVMFTNSRAKWSVMFEQDIHLMSVTPVAAVYTSPWREPVAVQGPRMFMQTHKPPGKPIGTGPRVHAKPKVTEAEIVDIDEAEEGKHKR